MSGLAYLEENPERHSQKTFICPESFHFTIFKNNDLGHEWLKFLKRNGTNYHFRTSVLLIGSLRKKVNS